MLIIENLEIEVKLPIYMVEGFVIRIEPNRHASLDIFGVLTENPAENIFTDKKDIDVNVKYEGKTVFRGFVEEFSVDSDADVHRFKLSAYSYSKELDKDKHTELFQDIDETYISITQDIMKKYPGTMATYDVNDKRIEKPLLCYEESAWNLAIRMAANLKTFIYPDMTSDKPSISMGLKEGRLVEPKDIISESREIKKDKGSTQRSEYKLRTYSSYEIGDQVRVGDKVLLLYKKEAEFTKGELIFNFQGIEKAYTKELIKPFYNEDIIGLSLMGKIKKYKDKKIYISLDCDKKEAKYGFDWYPETGNALYAVPEVGEKAELYVSGVKPGEMYILRTFASKGKDAKQKMMESGKISFGLSCEGVSFKSEDMVFVEDECLKLNGTGGISLSAAGKISIKARNIRMNSKDEIVYVSE